MMNSAKKIIYALAIQRPALDEKALDEQSKSIIQKIPLIENAETLIHITNEPSAQKKKFFSIKSIVKAAAIFAGIVLVSFFIFRNNAKKDVLTYEHFYTDNKKLVLEFSNNTPSVQRIQLPDGSTALLETKSRLSYLQNNDSIAGNSKREIFLEGACFFSVTKNPMQPFIVYTKSIVTKVLGTSFRIKAYPEDKEAKIEVRTGKVSVYKKEDFKKEATQPGKLGGLVLLPNQKVVCNTTNPVLLKSLINEPVAVLPAEQNMSFIAAPITEVLKNLEQQYGIQIIYDSEVLSECTFTASFGNETYYQKLNLICKSISSRYEVIEGTVIIYSDGCK